MTTLAELKAREEERRARDLLQRFPLYTALGALRHYVLNAVHVSGGWYSKPGNPLEDFARAVAPHDEAEQRRIMQLLRGGQRLDQVDAVTLHKGRSVGRTVGILEQLEDANQ